jgi:hypothetical protein
MVDMHRELALSRTLSCRHPISEHFRPGSRVPALGLVISEVQGEYRIPNRLTEILMAGDRPYPAFPLSFAVSQYQVEVDPSRARKSPSPSLYACPSSQRQ